jgi:hypothetical protein
LGLKAFGLLEVALERWWKGKRTGLELEIIVNLKPLITSYDTLKVYGNAKTMRKHKQPSPTPHAMSISND